MYMVHTVATIGYTYSTHVAMYTVPTVATIRHTYSTHVATIRYGTHCSHYKTHLLLNDGRVDEMGS